MRICIAYCIGHFFDHQRRNSHPEPASRTAVSSEHSFHFVFLVDGGYGGLGIFLEALFGARCAKIDSVHADGKTFDLFQEIRNRFDATISIVLDEEYRVRREVER